MNKLSSAPRPWQWNNVWTWICQARPGQASQGHTETKDTLNINIIRSHIYHTITVYPYWSQGKIKNVCLLFYWLSFQLAGMFTAWYGPDPRLSLPHSSLPSLYNWCCVRGRRLHTLSLHCMLYGHNINMAINPVIYMCMLQNKVWKS